MQKMQIEIKNLIIEDFKEYFDYKNGELYWKNCRYKAYNGKKAGHIHKTGYWRIKLNKENYQAHRIIFAMHHDFMPEFIDHIDGDTSNNKIENLREATRTQNFQNSKKTIRNKSGVKGVFWHKIKNRWIARVSVNGKEIHVGTFTDLDEATKAVKQFREKHHGEYARHD